MSQREIGKAGNKADSKNPVSVPEQATTDKTTVGLYLMSLLPEFTHSERGGNRFPDKFFFSQELPNAEAAARMSGLRPPN
jgi:hypothetical protein